VYALDAVKVNTVSQESVWTKFTLVFVFLIKKNSLLE